MVKQKKMLIIIVFIPLIDEVVAYHRGTGSLEFQAHLNYLQSLSYSYQGLNKEQLISVLKPDDVFEY